MRVLALTLIAACDREPRPQIDLSREHDSAITYQGVSFTTVFEVQANEQAPLLVMLHGLGDTAKEFREAWPAIPIKLQLSFPLAPLPHEGGRSWFEWPRGMTDQAFADAVTAAEAKLWPAIVELAHGRKVMIGGFSQGAVVAYAIAIHHPDEVSSAFLISGRIPRKLAPGPRTPPIAALHGVDDPVISIGDAREGIASLKTAGATATLYEYPGVGHTITPAMFDQVIQLVRDSALDGTDSPSATKPHN